MLRLSRICVPQQSQSLGDSRLDASVKKGQTMCAVISIALSREQVPHTTTLLKVRGELEDTPGQHGHKDIGVLDRNHWVLRLMVKDGCEQQAKCTNSHWAWPYVRRPLAH